MRRSLAVTGLALLTIVPAATAQQETFYQAVVQLVTEGQRDSAKALVRQRLASLAPRDSAYAEALFAAGVVAGDADSSVFYFRRVSIEHGRSGWADRALLRLAQTAFASRDAASALRSAERILTDYPLSELRAEAAYWAAQAQFELGQLAEGCRLLEQATREAGSDVELANRVRFHQQRCAAVAPERDSTAADSAAVEQPATGPVVYTVQVAAVRNAAAADELMQSLHAAGYASHVVRDTDGLFKVRVGRYAARRDAERLASDLRQRLGGSPFVVEER
ncbi:MAG: SPOR domain-containing protein [Gemmatimonadales bacterium]